MTRVPFRVVLGDANVLYSRVLRDYLLYAMTLGVIRVHWSAEILAEVVEHLIENVDGFDGDSGKRLVTAMNSTFPYAEVTTKQEDVETVAGLAMPDEDDRHVLAAAISAEVDILCTDNIKDFPAEAMAVVGIEAMTADALLRLLMERFEEDMVAAHRMAVSRLPGATDESTMNALRRAGAPGAAELMTRALRRATR